MTLTLALPEHSVTTLDRVHHCDALTLLRGLPDQHVNCIVTSPPYYGLRNYGVDGQIGLEDTPEQYVARLVALFREARRVLRDDGTLWLNLGDSYAATSKGSGGMNSIQPTNAGSFYEAKFTLDNGLKPKDLIGIPWRVAFALQADGWWLRSDIIWHKCLSGGTMMYARTQKGEMPTTLKDLVRLDPSTVQLWDGIKWNQVLAWGEVSGDPDRKKKSQIRRSAKYRGIELPVTGDIELEFRNGERIGCTREHKWPTQRGIVEASDLVAGDVIPIVTLPEPPRPAMPSALDDEDTGWLVGLYLAEGSRSDDCLQFSGHIKETERHERLERIAAAYHGTFVIQQHSENSVTAQIHGPVLHAIVNTYINGKDAKSKHLHPRCWSRSNAFLNALLMGYLEGDGHVRPNGSWRLGFTNNDALASDLRVMAARLGYSLRLRRRVAVNTTTGKHHKIWRGDLVFDPAKRRNYDGEIVAIRQSRARKFHNVTLAEAPHTFALACGICTQNSNPMPESVRDRPTKAHEYVFLLTKAERYFYDADAIRDRSIWQPGMSEDKPRGSFNGKYDNADGHAGSFRAIRPTRNKRTVWTVPTEPKPFQHFAMFPQALIEPMILAGCPAQVCSVCGAPYERVTERTGLSNEANEIISDYDVPGLIKGSSADRVRRLSGATYRRVIAPTNRFAPTCDCDAPTRPGIVYDPFMGSGTTALVAQRLKRHYIGTDINAEYVELARKRLHYHGDDSRMVKEQDAGVMQRSLFDAPAGGESATDAEQLRMFAEAGARLGNARHAPDA